ncbi:MAG: hypothetical protein KGI79_02520 [Patescibacteria group bacterium]|nr:hypothetical protein [Patescibacteria group bacterium]MDE2116725.1 hypothetical protein [Patescibacteria group bacterium]
MKTKTEAHLPEFSEEHEAGYEEPDSNVMGNLMMKCAYGLAAFVVVVVVAVLAIIGWRLYEHFHH